MESHAVKKSVALLLLCTALGSNAAGLFKRADEVKETWCAWNRPQSALIRDTIYLDGGETLFVKTRNGIPADDLEPRQQYYTLNLTVPFDLSKETNVSAIIRTTAKGDLSFTPNTANGHMLANNFEFIEYGGLIAHSDAPLPDRNNNWALAYDLFSNPKFPTLKPGWRPIVLSGVTGGVASGAVVNVPSENLGFIIGGSRNRNWGPVRGEFPTPKYMADTLSNTMVSVDLSEMKAEKWDNRTLDSNVKPRTAGEAVWIPAGKKGSIVLLGGTTAPLNVTDTSKNIPSDDRDKYEEDGKEFMEEVSLYDIDGDKWYTQKTSGDIPPPTAEFCTAVATSQSGDSHHIYAYGGYSGAIATGSPLTALYDSLYVLSVPSFVWTRISEGSRQDGRRGHRCHRVADNKMLVIGGAGPNCHQSGFIRVLDLNKGSFGLKYTPADNKPYEIPESVVKKIGGNAKGGADVKPSSWDNDDLADLFAVKPSKTVKNSWPYKVAPTNRPPSSSGDQPGSTSQPSQASSGLPNYVPPLLGAILGLLVIITILCLILFFLRRRKNKMKRLQSDSAASAVVKKRQTWSWLMGTADEKAHPPDDYIDPTPATEHSDPFDASYGAPPYTDRPMNEAPGGEIYEMPGSATAQELPVRTGGRRVTISDEIREMGPNGQQSAPISPLSPRPTTPPSNLNNMGPRN